MHVAAGAESAKATILGLIPEGARVGQGASRTLDDLGVTSEIETSGRFDALRPRWRAMDRATQAAEIRQVMASADVWLNSANAVTEDGVLVFASATGTQIAQIASGPPRVILAIGAQKIVTDLAAAFRRIESHVLRLEDARTREAYGMGTALRKQLIVHGDVPGRISVVLIPEAIGF